MYENHEPGVLIILYGSEEWRPLDKVISQVEQILPPFGSPVERKDLLPESLETEDAVIDMNQDLFSAFLNPAVCRKQQI